MCVRESVCVHERERERERERKRKRERERERARESECYCGRIYQKMCQRMPQGKSARVRRAPYSLYLSPKSV